MFPREDATINILEVARLNDLFRQTFAGGKVVMTSGVARLTEGTKSKIIDAVRAFDAFTEDNDPHGEHDFGSFSIEGEEFFFKIDYYDLTLTHGSENPTDPAVTVRILTIMQAREY